VEEKVMDEAGIIIPDQENSETFDDPGILSTEEDDKQLSPLDLLNKQLKSAIVEERYEDAAKYRDEIDRLTNSN
jgi:protein-arginine kinase activator protein McsA